MKLRNWQKRGLESANSILVEQDKSHFYAEAPTGTGKSYFKSELCGTLPVKGERIVVVGLDQIVSQHRASFLKYGWFPISNETFTKDGQYTTIMTWQALSNIQPRKIGLLLFDECHIGAATLEAKTIRKIINDFDPTKLVSVSATTRTSKEDILGKKEGHFFKYSYSDAFEDGVLNPVSLVEVHTGVDSDIQKVQQIEQLTGKNMDDISELSGDDIHDLATQFKDKSVSFGLTPDDIENTIKDVIRHKHIAMSEIYFEKHGTEQALFFSPSISAAEQGARDFNSRARQKNIKARADFCHSQMGDTGQIVSRFNSGETSVLFVVGMLQEGYDHPNLRLAFDCRFNSRWTESSITRLQQRIGRVMRKPSSPKDESLYYFSRSIIDIYNSDAITHGSIPQFDDDSFESGAFVAKVFLEMEDNSEEDFSQTVDVYESDVETFDTDESFSVPGCPLIKLVKTPLYVAKRFRGSVIVNTFSVKALFGNSADANKELLLRMAADPNQKRPPQRSKIGSALSSYTSKSSKIYDEVFDKKIREIKPDWFVNTADANKGLLLRMASDLNQKRPPASSKIGSALSSYSIKSSCAYDEVFDKKIRELRPDWFVNTADANKDLLLRMAADPNQKRPPVSSKIGSALSSYSTKSSQAYDEVFDKKIRELRPDWFVNTADANKDLLLRMAADPNQKRPPKSSKIGSALSSSYSIKSSCAYDEVFDKKIRELRPDWFRK